VNIRRTFFITAIAGGTALAAGLASAQSKLDEKDPLAIALGYVADSTKADKIKYPNHSNDKRCSSCQLYSGSSTDATAGCAAFSGKHVAGVGWCSAYSKKAT
jgi:High potential iron-sulfur protein